MSQHPPRDYPATGSSVLAGSDEMDDVTLGSVKARLEAQQPVSNEMIDKAVSNLFSVDSHDTFDQSASEDLPTQPSLRNWLKKTDR